MNYDNEIWKIIEGYEEYEVSSMGRVRSLKRKAPHILKPTDNGNGYLTVVLCKDGKQKCFKVHRLVAQAFIPNPKNKPTVDHVDRCKTNNCVENLRWADYSEQKNNQNKKSSHSPDTKFKVRCVETNEIFNNSVAAARWVQDNNLSIMSVGDIAKYIRKTAQQQLYGFKTAFGYHWEFYYGRDC